MHLSPLLAEINQPLFGNQWLALLAILAGVAVFILAVAAVGRWLAATHPDEPAPAPAAPTVQAEASPEIFAVIAAAVSATLGSTAQITAVAVAPAEPVVEPSRLQWSMEGRRQIYSSHKVR